MPIPMAAGNLRHLVTIQRPAETPGAYGQVVPTWQTVMVRHAEIKPLSGRELWYAAQVSADVTHSVTLRYTPGLTISPKWQVLYQGRTFAIESVINTEERNRELVLLCKEQV